MEGEKENQRMSMRIDGRERERKIGKMRAKRDYYYCCLSGCRSSRFVDYSSCSWFLSPWLVVLGSSIVIVPIPLVMTAIDTCLWFVVLAGTRIVIKSCV